MAIKVIKHFYVDVKKSDLFDDIASALGIDRDEAFDKAVELFACAYYITNKQPSNKEEKENESE
ncbi:MAG: hypothetical protein Q8O88_03370 [bacterium]|nr:hypothetical protein [bacterium]